MATRVGGMRKSPSQQRSRATVDVIVGAAARVLARHGWAGFNTNAVAAAGGVSVGSIYQYFPDKIALLGAVRRRHHEEILAVLKEALRSPPERRIEQLIDGLIATHGDAPGLHRVLLQQCPASAPSLDREFEAEYLRLYSSFLDIEPEDERALAVSVLTSAVEAVIHDAACTATLENAKLRQELVTLVAAYVAARGGEGSLRTPMLSSSRTERS